MWVSRRRSGVLGAWMLCCTVSGLFAPDAAKAEGAGLPVTEGASSLRLQSGPCGLRSLRGQGGQGGGADLAGIWQCVQHALLPARFSAAEPDSDNPAFNKKNSLKFAVRIRQDQVLVTVGLKW